jgi:signal peptidase II
MMPAIFNVADIFIVCGMIAVALLVVLGLRFDGTREKDDVAADADADAYVLDVDADPLGDGAEKTAEPIDVKPEQAT